METQRDKTPAEEAWLRRLDESLDARTPAGHARRGVAAGHEPVFVPRPHPASLTEEALLAQCSVGRSRSSGPGGQHRNKVETMITLTHRPTGLQAHAGERRSLRENRPVALQRLRLVLATGVRYEVPNGEARTELWKRRCGGSGKAPGRIVVSPRHEDYPAMLAEALDMLRACGLDQGAAAARLCCTPSQLVKLVKEHPPAFTWLNAQRAGAGLKPLQ